MIASKYIDNFKSINKYINTREHTYNIQGVSFDSCKYRFVLRLCADEI
jgi:hypothetical protein